VSTKKPAGLLTDTGLNFVFGSRKDSVPLAGFENNILMTVVDVKSNTHCCQAIPLKKVSGWAAIQRATIAQGKSLLTKAYKVSR